MSNYHYVVFGCERDYFQIMFKDAIDQIGVEYIDNPIRYNHYNKFFQLCYNFHHNKYVNWLKEIPLKEIWYPLYYKKKINQPVCFVFLMSWCNEKFIPLFNDLKKKYPDCKFILYLEDIIASRRKFNFNCLSYFDKVISYDEGDSKQYGFEYYPTFMSHIAIPKDKEKSSDVCFWGVEKGRGKAIASLYEHLSSNGLKCDFLVSQAKGNTIYPKGVKLTKKDKSYLDYLNAIENSRIIIEIMQKRAVGYTLRTWESLLYDKILLTNNESIKEAPFYDPRRVFVYKDINDIDIKKLSNSKIEEPFDSESISPVRFFDFIEKNILK